MRIYSGFGVSGTTRNACSATTEKWYVLNSFPRARPLTANFRTVASLLLGGRHHRNQGGDSGQFRTRRGAGFLEARAHSEGTDSRREIRKKPTAMTQNYCRTLLCR